MEFLTNASTPICNKAKVCSTENIYLFVYLVLTVILLGGVLAYMAGEYSSKIMSMGKQAQAILGNANSALPWCSRLPHHP